MKSNNPSLLGRALLALALMIGFYLLAVGITLGLLYVVYAEVRYAHRITPRLALACLAGAGAILWSVIPRRDHFQPPGPQLDPARQPRLFKELCSVAESVRQTMPAEVYLVPDVNAWVSSRGGVMGFGSRRVMGVGLPLLQVLSVAECRAVLAHEFGHYHGGATALAPWVYKTRVAIGRTLQSLQEGFLHLPFLWYGKLFLRVSHAVSRQQEYAADALAARVVGAGALVGGLKSVHRAAEAFQAYWRGEVAPVLSAGFRPPVAAGFAAFMNAEHISRETASSLAREMENQTESPYDTHPSLKDRIVALGGEKIPEPGASAAPAMSLLDDVDALERELLSTIFPDDAGRAFKNIRWSDTLADVYLPAWKSTVVGVGRLHGQPQRYRPSRQPLCDRCRRIGDRVRTLSCPFIDLQLLLRHVHTDNVLPHLLCHDVLRCACQYAGNSSGAALRISADCPAGFLIGAHW
jgi:Zn-dependent protease with chaperone function